MPWDVFKANRRGKYMSAVAAVRAEQNYFVSSLQPKVDHALTQYTSSPTVKNFYHFSLLRREFHLHISEVTRLDIQNLQAGIF